MNRKALERINYGLFVVGAAHEGTLQGCIVNSLHQVTAINPFQFTLTVNKSSETFKAIEAAGSFAATVLRADTPGDLVKLFGYKSGRVARKFEGLNVGLDEAGNPYLKDNALARISCKVAQKVDLGSYMLYIATVTEAETLGEGKALTVDDFKNGGNPIPPAATVYRTVEIPSWKCTVCGYIVEREELPDDFKCPLCRAGKDKFVKL